MFPTPVPAESLDAAGLQEQMAAWSEAIRYAETVLAGYAARFSMLTREAAVAAGRSEKAAIFESQRSVQAVTKMSRRDVAGLVDVGAVLDGSAQAPWLAPIAEVVADQSISVDKGRIIQAGVGAPNERVTAEDLKLVVEHLAEVAVDLTPEQLERHTRAMREDLDLQFIADEEQRIRERRSAVFRKHRDGSSSLHVQFDKEATPVAEELFRTVLGPRQGGPRFVSEAGQAYEQAIVDDPRADEQLAHDALVAVLRMGLSKGTTTLPGRPPAVRVVVTERDLREGTGYGVLEDGTPITLPAVEAAICDGGYVQVVVDEHGKPLNHGHEKRLFTEAQRTALAIRDGGCRNPDCDRPPGMCEAHHAEEWVADHGPTNLDNGILLCKRDHLDLHNRKARLSYEPDRDMWVCIETDGTRRDWPTKARIQKRIHAAA